MNISGFGIIDKSDFVPSFDFLESVEKSGEVRDGALNIFG